MKFFKEVFEKLRDHRLVETQQDLCDMTGYKNGYVSDLMRRDGPIPKKFQQKLHEVFGISREYLSSNGAQGTMFPAKDYPHSQTNSGSFVNEDNTHYTSSNKDNKNNSENENNNSQFIPSSFTKYYDEMISSELLKIIHKRDEQMDELIGVIKSLARRNDENDDAQTLKRKAG